MPPEETEDVMRFDVESSHFEKIGPIAVLSFTLLILLPGGNALGISPTVARISPPYLTPLSVNTIGGLAFRGISVTVSMPTAKTNLSSGTVAAAMNPTQGPGQGYQWGATVGELGSSVPFATHITGIHTVAVNWTVGWYATTQGTWSGCSYKNNCTTASGWVIAGVFFRVVDAKSRAILFSDDTEFVHLVDSRSIPKSASGVSSFAEFVHLSLAKGRSYDLVWSLGIETAAQGNSGSVSASLSTTVPNGARLNWVSVP